MKMFLQKILASLARATIRKYNPIVVGVTGSVGKTSTREAIFSVAHSKWNARRAEKNFNNEIGLPLAILGLPNYGRNAFSWCRALFKAWWFTKFRRYDYPAVLVLEYAVDRPGDMNYLLSIVKPKIAVVTAIGEVPVHVEFFKDPEALIQEKAKLVAALPPDGCAILNHDDFAVYGMKEKARGRVFTFGFEKHAQVKITNYELRTIQGVAGTIPAGISFKIENAGSVVPIRLHEVFGRPQAYAAAAAAGVGLLLNMNLIEISRALEEHRGVAGRLRLLEGIKNSFIIDDSYNASPDAMQAALDTLKVLPGKRKIAVLGDMLEIGRYTEQVHRAVGDRAAEFVDLLFTVGPRAKFIADAAHMSGRASPGMAGREASLRIQTFDDALSAGKALDPAIEEGDLILVKGSESMRMEKVVEEVMRYPLQAEELLVRQDEGWKRK